MASLIKTIGTLCQVHLYHKYTYLSSINDPKLHPKPQLRTPLLKEELKRAKTVLQMLYDSNDSAEFCETVDWESTYRIQSTSTC